MIYQPGERLPHEKDWGCLSYLLGVDVVNPQITGADPEISERGGQVPHPPPHSPNENFTFQDVQHTALWAYS